LHGTVRPENANTYSRWESCPVRFSQPPVLSLGAEVVTLGLSVGRGAIEPQPSKRAKQYSPVSKLNAEADVLVSTAGNNDVSVNGELVSFLSGSESVARLTSV